MMYSGSAGVYFQSFSSFAENCSVSGVAFYDIVSIYFTMSAGVKSKSCSVGIELSTFCKNVLASRTICSSFGSINMLWYSRFNISAMDLGSFTDL